jgi:hypothetical protein
MATSTSILEEFTLTAAQVRENHVLNDQALNVFALGHPVACFVFRVIPGDAQYARLPPTLSAIERSS